MKRDPDKCPDFSSTGYPGRPSNAFAIEAFRVNLPGIVPLHPIDDIPVYPNPASDQLTLHFNQPVNGEVKYVLFNAVGQEVVSRIIGVKQADEQFDIPVNGLSTGLYFLCLESGESTCTRKVVISR